MDWHDPTVQAKLQFELSIIFPLLADSTITEVILNPDGKLWAESTEKGLHVVQEMSPEIAFNFLCTVSTVIGTELTYKNPTIGTKVGLKINETFSYYRLQGAIPPVTIAPIFTIRKPPKKVFSLDDYAESGIMTEEHRDFISEMVMQKKNILVAGSTNSGKTTLVNGVIDEISRKSPSDRILVLEDTNEIICNSANTLTMETSDERSMTQLVRDSLRHRPDRIIVGELRGSEALDLIDAWNTGHPGGLTTLHANNARSALKRLEQLIVRNNIPPQREEIAEVVNVVIFIKRDISHPARRRVREVIQVNGYDGDYVIEQV